jgi:hypothetical protein
VIPLMQLNAGARAAWPALPAAARPGTVWVDDAGARVRVLADGSAEEIGAIPRRCSAAADASARRKAGP